MEKVQQLSGTVACYDIFSSALYACFDFTALWIDLRSAEVRAVYKCLKHNFFGVS